MMIIIMMIDQHDGDYLDDDRHNDDHHDDYQHDDDHAGILESGPY